IVLGAFMLWSASLANICLAQASAMGAPSAAADSTQTQTDFLLVQLKNGAWFYGQVVEWNKEDQTLTLDTDSLGTILFRRKHITRTVPGPISASERLTITGNERAKRNQFLSRRMWRNPHKAPKPHAGRYFFAPSAFQLKKGEANYHNSFLLSNEMGTGFTDDLTVGTNIIFDLGFGLAAKFGRALTSNVHSSAGGAVLFPFRSQPAYVAGFVNPIFPVNDGKNSTAALVFANVTLGSENRNITFNWCASNAAGFDTNVFNISALLPIDEQTWLITENYFQGRPGGMIGSIGIRRFIKRWGFPLDYAFVALPEGYATAFVGATIPINH
ncbi:MAG: hypothetical protein VX286_09530, partial [Bacteroidota bacterium]|nr:hypothetical protein [Bacteroidota bacterium]